MTSLIDLHLHSTCSDGSDSPAALAAAVAARGMKTVSLTDHDTICGIADMQLSLPPSIRFITGVELSCYTECGKCHILGYGFDPASPSLCALLERGSRLRQDKLEARLDYLEKTHHIILEENELSTLRAHKGVGKPHLAALLIKRGLAADIGEAITRYLNSCKTENDRLPAAEAIAVITDAGGVAVWAHPLGGEGERHLSGTEFQNQLKQLLSDGICGLECCYSRYGAPEREYLLSAAVSHALLASGGSDYHGTVKNIGIGELSVDGAAIPPEVITVLSAL